MYVPMSVHMSVHVCTHLDPYGKGSRSCTALEGVGFRVWRLGIGAQSLDTLFGAGVAEETSEPFQFTVWGLIKVSGS